LSRSLLFGMRTLGYSGSPSSKKLDKERITASVKARMAKIVQEQPEDATYQEIICELGFERMVERGLADSRAGRSVQNEEMLLRIKSWRD
jgi:predicted transcriptional regulator